MPDNLFYFSLRTLLIAAVICNLHDHLVSVHCPSGMLDRNENIFCKFQVIRNHKAKIPALLIRSHNFGNRMVKNLDHHPFPALARLCRKQGNLHRIAMNGRTCVCFRNKNILFFLFKLYKAKSSGVSYKFSGKYRRFRNFIFPAFRLLYFSVPDQFLQNLQKFLPVFSWHL